ncbi:653334ef-50da-4205-813b-9ab799248b33 [Sclerotinia trifoliorum]|uniref:653334ef-50da-4205-813b-9ab799248b33 n=1 Tax=Sclerotinia trifoliorum TaxID=28548 RepID=A0A8H2W264_9HELO|nr:653334ef-50da-4205-813b-9ab799248b33 [Sclerotinia trifoliorum]
MTSSKDIQTPFAKGASIDNKDASTEKTPVNNNQTSDTADTKSTPSTMAPTTKHLSSFNSKRRSATSSDKEEKSNDSFKTIKRTRIEGQKKTPTSHRPPSRGQSSSSRGLTRPEEHLFDIPGGAVMFGKSANKEDLEGFLSAVTPSKKLIDIKAPAQVAENKTFKFSSPAETSSSTSSTPIPDAEEDEEKVLSPPSTSPARLTSLNEIMRRIYNAKPEDTNSLVLCRDMAEIMNIKDYNFAVMSKRLAKLEKDAEANLSAANVTNSVTYKELLEKFNASQKRAAIAEKKVLQGDPADNRTMSHLQRQMNELEAIHNDNLKAYEDLERKYNQTCQTHNDKCKEPKEEIHGREQRMEGEFQRSCNLMENHYRQENQHLRSEIRSYQLENQHLQSELAQGRQWANSIVKSCPHPVDRLIEAENARDCAFAESDEVVQARNEAVRSSLDELQEIEQEKARILKEHNEYLRGRTMAAGSEDDGVPYTKKDSAEKGRHDGMYSAKPPHQRQKVRAQSPQEKKWYRDNDANHHFSSHTDNYNDSDNDGASFPPAVPAAGLAAKLQTRKSRDQLREYQPINSNFSQGIHRGFTSTQAAGNFRTIFKCPQNRGSRGNNCSHCGEQMFFEGDKEFVSKQPSITPQEEDNFDALPDYESDEPVSPPPEQPNRGGRSYTEVGVQPYAAIPDSPVSDDTTPSPEEECLHPIMFENKCGACGESMKDASNVSLQAAPVAKNKLVDPSTRRGQSLAKKAACQHVHLDNYGVCEACLQCQHLKVNDDNGNCKFCWANVNHPVATPGVAASPDSSTSSPASRKRRDRPSMYFAPKSDSKAWSRPIRKVKAVTKNSLDIMFPTLPAFQPAQANPFSSLATALSSGNSRSSAASFFKAAHPGWKAPAVLSSPVSPPAPAAHSAAAALPKCSQPKSCSSSLAPSNEET